MGLHLWSVGLHCIELLCTAWDTLKTVFPNHHTSLGDSYYHPHFGHVETKPTEAAFLTHGH